jgi:DNA-binding Lrp family transcriptional regulator
MTEQLDSLDVKILGGLAEYGPRNITKVARGLNVPRGTIISRIERMSSSFYLRLLTTVYHTNLGMKKAVVFAKAIPGQEDTLFNCLKANEFYIYLSRCFGMFEGCVAIYVIPIEYTAKFQDFLMKIKEMGMARDIDLFWSTCFHTVNLTGNWFDNNKETWVFPWEEWLHEVSSSESELPYTLKDPVSFPLRADETDLFIVKELEKNATVSLACVAREFGTTLQNIRYHYERHVVRHGLIETFQMAILPFDRATSDMLFFIFRFSDDEKMGKFANSLLDKPFVFILGKILNENSLVSQICLPRQEFRNFIDVLSKLARRKFLKNYEYVLQDLRSGKWARQTIPHRLFKNGSWTYDHSQHMDALQDLLADTKPECCTRETIQRK